MNIKFDIKVNKRVYGEHKKTEITFIVNDFDDMIDMFKIENNINMIRFLNKFKIYNPNMEEGVINGKIYL